MSDTRNAPASASAVTIALVCGHVCAAAGLLWFAALSGVFAPIPGIGAVWLLILARGMLRPTARLPQLIRITHAFALLIGVVLAVYGIFYNQSGAGQAASNGGLTIALGLVLTVVSCASLYTSRPPLPQVHGRRRA